MIKAFLTRIIKFYIGYHESPNAFCCKFCVYSIGVTNIYKCSRYDMPTDATHICRNFTLWSKAIEVFRETKLYENKHDS